MADSWVPFLLAFSCVYGQQHCTKWVLNEAKTSSEAAERTNGNVECTFNKENNTINVEAPISCLNSTVLREITESSQTTNVQRNDIVTLSFMSNNTLNTINLTKKWENYKKIPKVDCWCDFCERKAVKCTTCSPKSESGDLNWDKLTFILLSAAIIVGIVVFLFATFRKKIMKTCKPNNDSTECHKKASTVFTEEVTLADIESSSGTYSLPRPQIEVGRRYTAAPDFHVHPSIHRTFEDENEDETYTKIVDDDIDYYPGHQTHHVSSQACDVTPSFLETGCGQGDTDEGDYNRLGHQSNRNKPTDCVPAAEENYRHLGTPEARRSDGYELAKAVTDANVCFNKVKEKPTHGSAFHDNPSDDHTSQGNNTNTARDNSPFGQTSDEHTPHDDSLDLNTPHHQTFHDYAVCEDASHNNPSYESDSHDNHSPRHTVHDDTPHHKATPYPTPPDNTPDEKHSWEVGHISTYPHHENISAVMAADNNDNILEPLEQAPQCQPAYLGK